MASEDNMRQLRRILACTLLSFGGVSVATVAQAQGCIGARVTLCACSQAPSCVKDPEIAISFKGTDTYLPLPRLEIARTPQERAQGLMGRAALEDDQAMLFVYMDEAPRAFWMKDTPSSLDIIFINAAGRIVSIGAGAIPFDEAPIPSASPARYVLEVAAGRAEALGLRAGVNLSLETLSGQ
jgi:uncharacterized membrane protein (UPF0127 family)